MNYIPRSLIIDFDETFGIYYDADNNWFIDEDGYVIYDIYDLITPNDVFLFKERLRYMIVSYKHNKKIGVEINFPDGEYNFPENVTRSAIHSRRKCYGKK